MPEVPLERAIELIGEGRSILVLGAGFSKGATDHDDEPLLLASELAGVLAEELGEDPKSGLEEISGLYLDSFDSSRLLNLLRKRYRSKTQSRSQSIVSTLPWKRIYTTNYDDIVEKCFEKAEMDLCTLTRTSTPSASKTPLECVHLNGYINGVDEKNFNAEILLTDSQYFTNALRDSPWAGRLRADFHSARSIFFVGYSLYDFDISKVLSESGARGNIYFIQHEELSKANKVKFERFGSLHTIGIDQFAKLVQEKGAAIRREPPRDFLVNFREVPRDEGSPRVPEFATIRDLLVKGKIEKSAINWDLSQGEQKYRARREQIDRLADTSGLPGQSLFVRSDIGNGKKLFIAEVIEVLLAADFRCFHFDGISDNLSDDIAFLSAACETGSVAILFPDYYNHEHLIDLIRQGVPKAFLITSSTSAAWELADRKPKFPKESLIDVGLDQLTEAEMQNLDTLIDSAGLWGERSGQSREQRIDFIRRQCRCSLRSLLLILFNQEGIRNEIGRVFAEARSEGRESLSQFIQYLAICASSFDPSFKEVSEILGIKFANRVSRGNVGWTAEFFSLRDGRRNITSPVFSQYLLREFVSDREIIDEVCELAQKLERASTGNPLFAKLKNFPMRFSFVGGLFSDSGKSEKIVQYYESLRQLGLGGSNPLFWLQYAIACMSFRDYESAGSHFSNAYGKADGKNTYDTYQIDNHFARFLLESRAYESSFNDPVDAFRKAHEILIHQVGNKHEGHYPFRVAAQYFPFARSRLEDFSNDEVREFVAACEALLVFAESPRPELRNDYSVRQCKQELRKTLDFARALQ